MQRSAAGLLVVVCLLIGDWPAVAGGGPVPAQKPLAPDGRMQLSGADRCPVCAMFAARYPRTAAAMTLTSGETFYFCTNGCLLRTWLRPMAYLGRPRTAIARLTVRDYFSGRSVDAHHAVWVAGSDVVGPMGSAVVALEDAGQLNAFTRRHGAETVFRLDELDDALWRRISGHELPESQAK
ncbi:MAG TPA: nitrous oxide reductase accessory protein NosL [Desulfosarcina sp.]|nr:nitrous oxide reductase accessory protein NosL [Desulfosarcina sp.]